MKKNVIKYIISATLLAGCMPDTAGIDPPSDELNYPVGLAMTPSGKHLVALNSNFDLQYNAGTLIAIDVSDLAGALRQPQGKGYGRSADGGQHYLDETTLAAKQDTIRLGAFASDLELTPTGDRLMIPVRGDKVIVLVDLDREDGVLSCGQGEDRECDACHRVTDADLPIEPYEVTAFEYAAIDGSGQSNLYGAATHLSTGEVSLFEIPAELRCDGDNPIKPELVATVANVVPGASGIAANPLSRDVDPARSGETYVTGRHDSNPDIAVLRLLTGGTGLVNNNPHFAVVGRIALGTDLYSATDARGIAISSDGQRGYMVTREPAALMAIDLAQRKLIGSTVVGAEPSSVHLYEHDAGTPDDPRDDRTYAFVLCFSIDRVYIIDTSTMELVTTRSTGVGPQALAIDRERRRIYIANFRESTISVLTIDDAPQPSFDHLRLEDIGAGQGDDATAIVKIGRPRLPDSHN